MKKGLFIVLEGIDGSGTTTQANLLQKWMTVNGHSSIITCEPSDGPIGSLARQIIKKRIVSRTNVGIETTFDHDTLALLFAADRHDHINSVINPAITANKHVICDRYLLSSLAYQGARAGYRWVENINAKIRSADLTFFLRVKPEIALARIESSRNTRDMFEHISSMKDVAIAYDRAIAAISHDGNLITLDGEQNESEVHSMIIDIVNSMI